MSPKLYEIVNNKMFSETASLNFIFHLSKRYDIPWIPFLRSVWNDNVRV